MSGILPTFGDPCFSNASEILAPLTARSSVVIDSAASSTSTTRPLPDPNPDNDTLHHGKPRRRPVDAYGRTLIVRFVRENARGVPADQR